MAYLRLYDYLRTIQLPNLTQIVVNDMNYRLLAEVAAQEECIEKLTQKYDVAKEFTDTNLWSPVISYTAAQRVELNYIDYIPTTNYVVGNLVNYVKQCYICTGVTTATFDPTKWTLLGSQYDLFFITYPKPEFNYTNVYKVSDPVYYKGKIYTCAIATQPYSHYTQLQYGTSNYAPVPNVFPDDLINGVQYWGSGTAYSVTAGTLPTDITKWTKGDNRCTRLVQKAVDICLFHLHSIIPPTNIPQIRIDRYAEATAWLDMAKLGEITVKIPLLQPKTDGRIRWQSETRRINNY